MSRVREFLLASALLAVASACHADIVSSSIVNNFGSPLESADLDLPPAGQKVVDWAVWNNGINHSNELLGGPSDFGPLQFNGTQLTTSPTALPSWMMNFTGAANGAPGSGTNFGYGALYANPFTTGASVFFDITPNVALGASGTVQVFGQIGMGGTFGGQLSATTITVAADGSNDPDGDQSWDLGTTNSVDTWRYAFDFNNYNGETFNFAITTNFNALQPEHNIAAVLVSQVPEPSTMIGLCLAAMGLVSCRSQRISRKN